MVLTIDLHMEQKSPISMSSTVRTEEDHQKERFTVIQVGGIKNHESKYVFPLHDCNNAVGIGSIGTNSAWTIRMDGNQKNGSVTLQDCHDHYLNARPDGKIYTDSSKGSWANWWIEHTPVQHAKQEKNGMYFKNVHGTYLTANDGKVFCHGKGHWAKFEVHKPVVDGTLKFLKKNKRWKRNNSCWSNNYYFRLSENKLCCWLNKPNEISCALKNKPRRRLGLILPSNSLKPKHQWQTSTFKYIVRDETFGIKIKFRKKLPPLCLKTSTEEENNIWYQALLAEMKPHTIPYNLFRNSAEVERSRISFIRSHSEVSMSRSYFDPEEWEEDGEDLDLGLLGPVELKSVIGLQAERERKCREEQKKKRLPTVKKYWRKRKKKYRK